MSKGLKIRRAAAGLALAASVLAPAGMVLSSAAPASAGIPLSRPIVGMAQVEVSMTVTMSDLLISSAR